MTPHRPELPGALQLLARLNEAMLRRGLRARSRRWRPSNSSGSLMTDDIALTSPVQPELEVELRGMGFTKADGIGHIAWGWIHPELRLGFEVVANTSIDGTVDYRPAAGGGGRR